MIQVFFFVWLWLYIIKGSCHHGHFVGSSNQPPCRVVLNDSMASFVERNHDKLNMEPSKYVKKNIQVEN